MSRYGFTSSLYDRNVYDYGMNKKNQLCFLERKIVVMAHAVGFLLRKQVIVKKKRLGHHDYEYLHVLHQFRTQVKAKPHLSVDTGAHRKRDHTHKNIFSLAHS